jgi:rhodanese-related sulfurtransferase
MRAIITLIVFTVLPSGCSKTSDNEALVGVGKFERLIQSSDDEIILDVRTPKEFAAGHIPGAVLINLYDVDFRNKLSALDRSKPILVYCAAGVRSEKASEILKDSGFKKVYQLKNGVKAWSEAKKELVR